MVIHKGVHNLNALQTKSFDNFHLVVVQPNNQGAPQIWVGFAMTGILPVLCHLKKNFYGLLSSRQYHTYGI